MTYKFQYVERLFCSAISPYKYGFRTFSLLILVETEFLSKIRSVTV